MSGTFDEKIGGETGDEIGGDAPARRRQAAVALRQYGMDEAAIPKIVAAGYGEIAAQILEIAFENGVKVREDRDLAEILAAVTLDGEVPTEALVAVGEILAHVYKVNSIYQSGADADINMKSDIDNPEPGKENHDNRNDE